VAIFNKQKIFVTCSVAAILTTTAFFGVNNLKKFETETTASLASSINTEVQQKNEIVISKTPTIVKAIYVSGWSAGSGSYYDYLNSLFDSTEINAVVIDIKDSSGYVFYNANVSEVQKYKLYNYSIKDIDSIIKFFHDRGIYVIARISVFEDPMFAKNRKDLAVYDTEKTIDILSPVLWQDNKGLSWMDPSSKEVWDYNISLAKDAILHGFDEINFDYIRFPSDGNFSTLGFPIWDKKISRVDTIKTFFAYLRNQMPNDILSVDLFGLTTVSGDDLGIGQFLEDALEYFDYVCPMVYPSHYATGFRSFVNPAEHPYEVAQYSIESAYYRRKIYLYQKILKSENLLDPNFGIDDTLVGKIRPWLQDFNLGAVYTADMVKAEISAAEEFSKDDYNGFMLWNSRNYYTQEAINK